MTTEATVGVVGILVFTLIFVAAILMLREPDDGPH